MVERDRLRRLVLRPTGPVTPTNGVFHAVVRIAVDRGSRPGTRRTRGNDSLASALTPRPARPSARVDRAVARAGVHGRAPGERERARGRERRTCARSRARDRVRGGTGRTRSRLMTYDERMGLRRRDRRAASRSLRHLHDLVGAHVVRRRARRAGGSRRSPQRRLRRRGSGAGRSPARRVICERRERAARERDRLARRRARRRVERDVSRVPPSNVSVDLRDPAVAAAVQRLHEVDVVGGDRRRELEADVLPDRVAERGRAPRGLRVAVERPARRGPRACR